MRSVPQLERIIDKNDAFRLTVRTNFLPQSRTAANERPDTRHRAYSILPTNPVVFERTAQLPDCRLTGLLTSPTASSSPLYFRFHSRNPTDCRPVTIGCVPLRREFSRNPQTSWLAGLHLKATALETATTLGARSRAEEFL